jgi:hypothetical protein
MKKNIILSENNDLSTNDVMKWCKIKGHDVHRINYDDRNFHFDISVNSVRVSTSFDFFTIAQMDY